MPQVKVTISTLVTYGDGEDEQEYLEECGAINPDGTINWAVVARADWENSPEIIFENDNWELKSIEVLSED